MKAISCLEIVIFLTNSSILVFIHCSQKGPDLPSFSIPKHPIGVYYPTQASDHNYTSSCLKFTNSDIT